MSKGDRSWGGFTETPVASAARTTSGDSGPLYGYGPYSTIIAQLNVTAASGSSPTLQVFIEDSVDGTNFNELMAWPVATGVSRDVRVAGDDWGFSHRGHFANQLRVRWAIGGTTPSFTFDVVWEVEG
jgi:hypothetical protein